MSHLHLLRVLAYYEMVSFKSFECFLSFGLSGAKNRNFSPESLSHFYSYMTKPTQTNDAQFGSSLVKSVVLDGTICCDPSVRPYNCINLESKRLNL